MAEDARLGTDRDVVGQRGSRKTQDRDVTENRELTDQDRLDMYRNELYNEVLPDLPDIPGYHLCWLTTTNPADSIQRRMRLGYEILRAEDVPGYEYVTHKTGEYAGFVGLNEMLAAKIPLRLYYAYMEDSHHKKPAEMDMALSAQIEQYKDGAEAVGGKIIEGDGMSDIHRSAPSRGVFGA